MKLIIAFVSYLLLTGNTFGQYNPQNGVSSSKGDIIGIVNAHIYVSSTQEYKNGEILIEEGKILKIGKKIKMPKGCSSV